MTFYGYPIVYASPSVNLGGFVEEVRAEAFARTLRDRLDVVALFGHDSLKPLGRVSANTLTLTSERRGAKARIDADESVSYVADLARVISRGDAPGGSFGFTVIDDLWSLRDGVPYRQLLDMAVREVSLGVSFPAYAGTRLYVGAEPPAQRSIAFARAQLRQLGIRA